MMKEVTIQQGQQIFFVEEKTPMKVLAVNERFAICARKMSKVYDRELLEHEVRMRAFFDIDEAFEYYKDDPVYTIIDFQERIRGPHNIILNSYDFEDPESMHELLVHLGTGETEISHRKRIELHIDVKRTEEINKNT